MMKTWRPIVTGTAFMLFVAAGGLYADELTGILRQQEEKKGQTPFLEIDGGQFGITKHIELSGELLKNVPEGTRIWIEGDIKVWLSGKPGHDEMQQQPTQWHIVFVVEKVKPISKPFETPKENRPQKQAEATRQPARRPGLTRGQRETEG